MFADASETFTLYGYANSSAEQYGVEYQYPFASIGEPVITGDITGDGVVDLADAKALFLYSMIPEMYPITYSGKVDYDGNGKVDLQDARYLFLFSMIPDMYPLE